MRYWPDRTDVPAVRFRIRSLARSGRLREVVSVALRVVGVVIGASVGTVPAPLLDSSSTVTRPFRDRQRGVWTCDDAGRCESPTTVPAWDRPAPDAAPRPYRG